MSEVNSKLLTLSVTADLRNSGDVYREHNHDEEQVAAVTATEPPASEYTTQKVSRSVEFSRINKSHSKFEAGLNLLHEEDDDAVTHTRFTALCPGLPGRAGTRKVKPIWILRKQETVSGSGISWAVCESAPRSRQITTSAPHHSSFLQAGCLSCRPTNSVKALKAVIWLESRAIGALAQYNNNT